MSSGNWNSGSTWNMGGLVPGSGDDVIIDIGHFVTINSESTVNSITVSGTDSDNYGKLIIEVGAVLNTTGHTNIYGLLEISGGVFNEGNSSGDKLTINGANLGSSCNLSISNGTLNISRYFSMINGSSFEMTGGILNVNDIGGSSSTDIFYVPSGTGFIMSDGTINILNGNLGTGCAVKLNPSSSNISGGAFYFHNSNNYPVNTFILNTGINNIISDIGNGNELVVANMANSSEGCSCNNITINSGRMVIDVGSGITVNNHLQNNTGLPEGFIVRSDNTGNGSLIIAGTVTGDICIQRYLDSYTSDDDGWHLISCPVNNMDIGNSDFEPGDNDDLYSWSENNNYWLNYKVPENNISSFENGKGYMIARYDEIVANFTGQPNNNDIIFNNLSSGNGNGWHLLGNPYPSAVIWGTGDWSLSNIGGIAKVWNEVSGNYTDVSAGGTIPSTNGFFVQVSSVNNSITIPSATRIHNGNVNNYKIADTICKLLVKVVNSQNNYFDNALITLDSNATFDYDIYYDSRKLFGHDEAPQLFTRTGSEIYSTNGLPVNDFVHSVQLDMIPGTEGSFKLIFDGISTFPDHVSLTLYDIPLGVQSNIKENMEYDFKAGKQDDSERFIINFRNNTSVSSVEADHLKGVTSNNIVYIINKQGTKQTGNLRLFDISGSLIYEGKIDHTGVYVNNGIYVIEFAQKILKKVHRQKLIVK